MIKIGEERTVQFTLGSVITVVNTVMDLAIRTAINAYLMQVYNKANVSVKDPGQDSTVLSGKGRVILFALEDALDLEQSTVQNVLKVPHLFTDAADATFNGQAPVALCLQVSAIQNVQLMSVSMMVH